MQWMPLALTTVASFIGTWLAAQFALARFYKEKTWERKTEAYTAIFEALHEMQQWFIAHERSLRQAKDLPEDKDEELRTAHHKARNNLVRTLDRQSWLLPPECMDAIDTL